MKIFRQGRVLHSIIAFILAVVYFQFQVEPFDREYDENNPQRSETTTISKPSITWESFDKQNAPKAFVVDVWTGIGVLDHLPIEKSTEDPHPPPFHPVRDKSPPSLFAEHSTL